MCVNILCLVIPQSLGSGQNFCPETRKGGLVVDLGDGIYEDITETWGKAGTPSHAHLLTTFSRSLKSQRACSIHSGHKYLSSVHCVFQAPHSVHFVFQTQHLLALLTVAGDLTALSSHFFLSL